MTDDFELDELSKALNDDDVSHAVLPDPKAEAIDPEDDRDNWPEIEIDYEDGKPNFEFLAASGTRKNGKPFNHELRVMRGTPVAVPPSIVNMLRETKRTTYRQRRDPETGRNVMVPEDRPPIPWRLVEKGKYVK